MHEAIGAHFQKLEESVRGTTVPAHRQEAIASAIKRLSALYAQYRETNESRFGDEIKRLVEAILKDLEACPEARKLDGAFREELRLLHEELGVPVLALKSPPPPPRAKKARKNA